MRTFHICGPYCPGLTTSLVSIYKDLPLLPKKPVIAWEWEAKEPNGVSVAESMRGPVECGCFPEDGLDVVAGICETTALVLIFKGAALVYREGPTSLQTVRQLLHIDT